MRRGKVPQVARSAIERTEVVCPVHWDQDQRAVFFIVEEAADHFIWSCIQITHPLVRASREANTYSCLSESKYQILGWHNLYNIRSLQSDTGRIALWVKRVHLSLDAANEYREDSRVRFVPVVWCAWTLQRPVRVWTLRVQRMKAPDPQYYGSCDSSPGVGTVFSVWPGDRSLDPAPLHFCVSQHLFSDISKSDCRTIRCQVLRINAATEEPIILETMHGHTLLRIQAVNIPPWVMFWLSHASPASGGAGLLVGCDGPAPVSMATTRFWAGWFLLLYPLELEGKKRNLQLLIKV